MNKKRVIGSIVEIFIITFISLHILVMLFEMKKLSISFKAIDYIWIFSIVLLVLKKYIEIRSLKIKNEKLKNPANPDLLFIVTCLTQSYIKFGR